MIDIWAKLQNWISAKQNWRLSFSLSNKGFPALVNCCISLVFCPFTCYGWLLAALGSFFSFFSRHVLCLKLNPSWWRALEYYIASGRQRGGNNSVAKPKQRLAFISPPHQVPGGIPLLKIPCNTHICTHGCTHTHADTHKMHTLPPHKTHLHSNASWTNDYRGPVRVLLCCNGERDSCVGVFVHLCM